MSHHATVPLLILAGVLSAAPAGAQECPSPTGRQIWVVGSATIRMPPDRVSVSVGVETLHANVSEAFRANARKVEAVLAALTNRVTATRENAAGVGELIEAAIAAGANEANRLSFSVADPGAAQKRGLELAFASARAKAETLAALAKQPLGEVLCVTEARGANPMIGIAMSSGGDTIEPGTEAITFAVAAVFALGTPAPR